jgi:hypothetical protein
MKVLALNYYTIALSSVDATVAFTTRHRLLHIRSLRPTATLLRFITMSQPAGLFRLSSMKRQGKTIVVSMMIVHIFRVL